MENEELDEIITLDDREFLIVKRVELRGSNYMYVFATDDSMDYSVLIETEIEGQPYVESINDEALIKEILTIVVKESI